MTAALEPRPAGLADIAALIRIEDAVFPGDRLERRHFRYAIRSATMVVLLLAVPDGLLGYVMIEFGRRRRVSRVSSLAVAPEAEGRGYGRRLLAAAEAETRRRGCDRVRLEVRADNARAAALYDAAGYRRIGEVAEFYEDGEAAIRYEKALDSPAGRVSAARPARPGPPA